VTGIRHYLLVRQRHNWLLFLRFGIVGASGVIVNLAVLRLCESLGPYYGGVWVDLPATSFNIRWYHVYVTIAFLVANVWNFQLNRWWTFQSGKHASWWREYVPFLLVGMASLALNLLIVTALMHPDSPIALSTSVFDDTSFMRSRLTWANFIAIMIVTPVSFALNKIWTFRSVRGIQGGRGGRG
jgi:putative flippase GtrA